MKFPHCNSLVELLDGDAFGICDAEFIALKSLFSAGDDDIVQSLLNIEEDNGVLHRKTRGSNIYTSDDRDNSLFCVKYLPNSEHELDILRNECSVQDKKFRRRFTFGYGNNPVFCGVKNHCDE